MSFDHRQRLSRRKQAIRRESDGVASIAIPGAALLAPLVEDLREALESGGRAATQSAASRLVDELLLQLRVPAVDLSVHAHRPATSGGELHGLYEAEEGQRPVITLWMRTAAQGRVVAFKTFLRTLLHEVAHHLDFELLGLRETFHTQGFFRRESSLVRQLLGGNQPAPTVRAPKTTEPRAALRRPRGAPKEAAGHPQAQLELPW